MAVELGRSWCARHGDPRFAHHFLAAAAEQQCSIGMSVRGGRCRDRPNYGAKNLRRQEAGLEDEGELGGVDERGIYGLNSPWARTSGFQIRTSSARRTLFFWGGRRRTDWK